MLVLPGLWAQHGIPGLILSTRHGLNDKQDASLLKTCL